MLFSTVLNSIVDVAIEVAVLLPFVWMAKKSYSDKDRQLLLIALLLFLFDTVINSYFSSIPLFKGQHWNWLGKSASIVWAIVFIYLNSIISPKEAGLTTRIQAGSMRFALTIMVVLAVVKLAFDLAYSAHKYDFRPETLLFQATLPGIAEELVYRGILLTILNKIFPPRWILFKAKYGWGAILTSLLFGLVHGFYVDAAWSVHFITITIIRVAIDGFFLALVKERTRSIVPPIIIHNVLNLIP